MFVYKVMEDKLILSVCLLLILQTDDFAMISKRNHVSLNIIEVLYCRKELLLA